jgi:hypothetical protein
MIIDRDEKILMNLVEALKALNSITSDLESVKHANQVRRHLDNIKILIKESLNENYGSVVTK